MRHVIREHSVSRVFSGNQPDVADLRRHAPACRASAVLSATRECSVALDDDTRRHSAAP